jgi:tRNA modification GTPase
VPGTTRDILELSLDIGGLPVLVADTAGLRETADEVERIGIERAQKACVDLFFFFFHFGSPFRKLQKSVQAADASLLVLAFPEAISVTPSGPRLEIPSELVPLVTPNTFVLLNKTDLLLSTSSESSATFAAAVLQYGSHGGCWAASLASQAGTDEFLSGLATALQDRYSRTSNSPEFLGLTGFVIFGGA